MKMLKLKIIPILIFTFLMPTISSLALNDTRSQVVDYMRKMATVEWASMEDMEYWNPKYGVMFKKDNIYKGIPYTQKQRNTDYELFLSNLENKDGVDYYKRSTGSSEYLGSDCSSAVSMAWNKVGGNFPILSTGDMIPFGYNQTLPVGSYKIDTYFSTTTKDIVNENGKEVMFSAYSKLQPADAVLIRNTNSGHVMMVSDVDHENNKVYIIDQTGANDTPTIMLAGNNGESTWRVDKEFTYDELLSKGCVPITIDALLASDKDTTSDKDATTDKDLNIPEQTLNKAV
ncbi:MAG: hypothetical protein RUMPE_00324 [Eubacteriales bacterium SKADARSKE-1]|nr:hypothetical protein [Eubacteriales bacterium SKADARSKE-1]